MGVNYGGAAFPTQETNGRHGATGMSLRDWFAGQALAGLMARLTPRHHMESSAPESASYQGKYGLDAFHTLAIDAYQIADDMIDVGGES